MLQELTGGGVLRGKEMSRRKQEDPRQRVFLFLG
jgi:hypothetical protein